MLSGESLHIAEGDTFESHLTTSLETNKEHLKNLPADGSYAWLEVEPGVAGVSVVPDDEAHRALADYQVAGLLGEDRFVQDILSIERQTADGGKVTGATVVYEMPITSAEGPKSAFLAIHSGARVPHGGGLVLTASYEHPRELDNRVRNARNQMAAASSPIRRFINQIRATGESIAQAA